MDLPKLTPGKRFTLPRPPRSADALLLAQLASARSRRPRHRIVTADANDAQRLIDEIVLRARPALRPLPRLGDAALRQLLAAPGPDQRAPGHAVAHLQKEADVVLVPATTALYRLAPPAFLAGYTFHFKVQAEAGRGQAEGPAHAGRLQPRDAGGEPRRIRRARRPDRPVPHGLAGAVPRRPVRRRDRLDPHLRPRHPAQPVPRARGAPAAGPRVPDGRRRPRALSQPLARTAGGRPDQEPHLQGHGQRRRHRRHRVLPAAVLRRDGHRVRLPRRRTPPWCCTATWSPPSSASGRTPATATAWCRATPSGPIAAARSAVPERRAVLQRAKPHAQLAARGRAGSALRRVQTGCPPFAVVRGAEDPLAR
jgi:transcription-repair coupling factor (superfamily II helicase)